MSDDFQLAAQRALRAYSLDQWLSMRPRERSDAIYCELRRIDASRAASRIGDPAGKQIVLADAGQDGQ